VTVNKLSEDDESGSIDFRSPMRLNDHNLEIIP